MIASFGEAVCEVSECREFLLMKWHEKLVSYCPIFTKEQEEYVQAGCFLELKKHNQLSYLMRYFSELGFEEEFRRYLIIIGVFSMNFMEKQGKKQST